MELKITREELLKGTGRAQAIAEKRSSMQILSNLLLKTTAFGIEILATDLEIGFTGAYQAQVIDQGQACLPARTFHTIIRELGAEEVSLKVQENQRILIEGGRARYHLAGLPAEEYPALPPHEEVELNLIHRGVGAISESDILLASASDAIIIGFNVRPDARARAVAAHEHVDVRLYRVIYEAVEDIRSALSGLLKPRVDENVVGVAEIRELFRVPRLGSIAGCFVSEGVIARNSLIRVVRDGVVVHEGSIGSLRRFKDDAREVQSGFECGIAVENFSDMKVGDAIEAYELVETARTL